MVKLLHASMKQKRQRVLKGIFTKSLSLLLISGLASCSTNGQKQEVVEAEYVTSHPVESDSLFLTDKVADIITLGDGYALAERNRATILILDKDLNPIKRIGKKGDGPEEFRKLGAIRSVGDQIAVLDVGKARIVFIDQNGKFIDSFDSDMLTREVFGFHVNQETINFSIAETNQSIVQVSRENDDLVTFEHTVYQPKSSHHSYMGNKSYMKKSADKYVLFQPTEMTVELLDEDFNLVNRLDISSLKHWEQTKTRVEITYKNFTNKSLQLYSDVYQDGNNFYILAYSDFQDPQSEKGFKRSLNRVIHISHNQEQNKLEFNSVIQLDPNNYYKQILVEGDKLLAFNLNTFFLDEYQID